MRILNRLVSLTNYEIPKKLFMKREAELHPWLQLSQALELNYKKFLKAGLQIVACSKTLYFLFKIRHPSRARDKI